jgi:hypothetical protein
VYQVISLVSMTFIGLQYSEKLPDGLVNFRLVSVLKLAISQSSLTWLRSRHAENFTTGI